METLNIIAMVLGYLVMLAAVAFLLVLLAQLAGGWLTARDYQLWRLAAERKAGNKDARRKLGEWRLFKARIKDALEYAGLEDGSRRVTLNEGGVWQGRGNWVLPDGTKGPKYRKLDWH